MEPTRYPEAIIERIAGLLEEGKSLREICAIDGFPSRSTVWRWCEGNDELAGRLREAREIGYLALAEEGMSMAFAPAAENPTDPQAARLAFDAVRWKLGKLSIAFRDKPLIEGTVNVAGNDAFGAFAEALERAAAGIASRADSTSQVALTGPPGSDHPAGD
ncbi:MAG: hypothetical protein V2I27_09380 [Erythrobacter sp.]|jgi:hypothetical protein|nr:hypothetical protein [Erythrobacter sp.]